MRMGGEGLEKFLARSLVSVRGRGILERGFDPEKLERGFSAQALGQYPRELPLAHGGELRSDGVLRIVPSVGAGDKAQHDEIPVTRPAGYDQLQQLDLPTAAG